MIGVDFGDSSVAAIGWVSRWFLPDSPLALAYGVWMPDGPSSEETPDADQEMLLEQAKREGRNALAPLVQEYGPSRTEALVGAGTPAAALLALAEEWGAELIAVGPHGHSRILTGFFGSTASRLLRDSKIPVLVVRSPDAGTPTRVLAAVDEGASTGPVLEATRAIADEHHCRVTGFHALERTPQSSLDRGPGGSRVDPEVHKAVVSRLKAQLSSAGIPAKSVHTKVGVGDTGRAICSAAAHDVDLIVMGTRGAKTGSQLGSAARYVVAHAPCPVLVVPVRDN